MGTIKPRGGVNEPGESEFLGWRGVFAKMAKRCCVNFVFMRFSITIFPRRVSDFRLNGASPMVGTVGSPRKVEEIGGGQNRFSKNLGFKCFAAKFASKVSRSFYMGQKG